MIVATKKGFVEMTTFCEYCNKFVDTHVEQYIDTMNVKNVPINIKAKGAFCDQCHHQIFDRDLDNEALLIAYHEYRNEKGLLQPEEIKQIRMKYGLSQVAFARLLGFGEKTIARYEGGSLQDEAPNSLIYLMKKPTNMLEMLNRYGKERLNEDELKSALIAANDLLFIEISVYKAILDNQEENQIVYKTVMGYQTKNPMNYVIRKPEIVEDAKWG